jgi:hypothetical protein
MNTLVIHGKVRIFGPLTLPPNLSELKLPDRYFLPLLLPNSLHIGAVFNTSVSFTAGGTPSLKRLIMHKKGAYNQDLDWLPPSLSFLHIRGAFARSLSSLPTHLQKLKVGASYWNTKELQQRFYWDEQYSLKSLPTRLRTLPITLPRASKLVILASLQRLSLTIRDAGFKEGFKLAFPPSLVLVRFKQCFKGPVTLPPTLCELAMGSVYTGKDHSINLSGWFEKNNLPTTTLPHLPSTLSVVILPQDFKFGSQRMD